MGQLENLMQAAREGNIEDLRLQIEQLIFKFQQGSEDPESQTDSLIGKYFGDL